MFCMEVGYDWGFNDDSLLFWMVRNGSRVVGQRKGSVLAGLFFFSFLYFSFLFFGNDSACIVHGSILEGSLCYGKNDVMKIGD